MALGPRSSLLSRLLVAVGVTSTASAVGTVSACGGRTGSSLEGGESSGQAGTGGTGGAAGASGVSGVSGANGSSGASGASIGGNAGSAGSAVCANPDSPPVDSSGTYVCHDASGFGYCDLHCYVPGPTTAPAPCLDVDSPTLFTFPNFQLQTCGLKSIDSGPYCNAAMEELGGAKPVCCYVGNSEACPGRPLRISGQNRVARLIAVAFV